MSWEQELADLADVPWSSFPNPNGTPPVVLVKAALVRGPQLGLTVIATDLVNFYLETIRAPRVIRNKIQSGSQDTQESQNSFVGEEGEKQLRAAVEEVLLGVRQGSAHVSLDLAGGGATLSVALPSSYTMTFDLDQLAGNLTSFILAQLVKPLLGLSSSLLGLLKSAASDKASLASQLESAIDRDGAADFRQEGRACNRLFQGGASSMLRRWEQVSSKGPKARNLEPVTLSGATAFAPRPTPTPAASGSRQRPLSPSPPPRAPTTTTSPMKGNAQRMLDHRKDAKGETVAWETQVVPARSPRKQGESSGGDHGKGKEKAGTVLDIDAEDNEEDPATEEDEPMLETALTAAQPRASRPRSAAAARGELESRSSSPSAPSPPPEASTRREEDELSQTQEQSDDAVDEKTEEERAQEEKRRAKEEKLAREKEELESRRQRLANLKATSAPSKVVPAHKKRKF